MNNTNQQGAYGRISIILIVVVVILFATFIVLDQNQHSDKNAATSTPTSSSSTPTDTATADLHESCLSVDCSEGLTCIEYYGFAGPQGPRFASCEIPCSSDAECPNTLHCTTIADGPGQVCS